MRLPTPGPRTAAAVSLALVAVLGGGRPAAAAVRCTIEWRAAATATYLGADGTPTVPARSLPAPPTPEHRPFHLFCGDRYVNTAWVAPVASSAEARRLAQEVIAGAVYPTVSVGANPARGLTGLASWFWALPETDAVQMLPGAGPRLELTFRVDTVRWRFGDATPGSVAGLGVPYPTPSPVAHVYERKGTYTVTGDVVLAGTYRYDGSASRPLDPGGHTVSVRHEVAEVRSLLHAR